MKSFAPSAPVAPRDRAGADIILALDTSSEFCSVAVCLPLASHDGVPATPTSAAAGDVTAAHVIADRRTAGHFAAATVTVPDAGSVRVLEDPVRGLRFVVVERDTGAVSSTYILPAIDQALQAAGVTLQDCAAVAFGAGPGSFTGLRTATGIVQGLAFGAGLPVLPVNTLMACAESARLRRTLGDCVNVVAAVDARMSECYHQAFHWAGEGRGWQAPDVLTDSGARVGGPETVVAPWGRGAGERYAVVGNAVRVFGERLTALTGATLSDADARPDAAAVASIGWRDWREGQALPAALALPDYVRNKVAQTTVERERDRQAKDAARGNA